MSERVSFGISQHIVNTLLKERYPILSKQEEVEGIFDEMHEQGQGYVGERLRELGREIFGETNAIYEIALTEIFDLIPFRYQSELLSPGYVDSVISVLKHSVEPDKKGFNFNLSWYENDLQDEVINDWQETRVRDLGPENTAIYKFGSSGMSFMFGFREFSKRLIR